MTATQLFGSQQVRSEWDAAQELWYFSIVDVVSVLTDSPNPRKYWSVLKNRLNKEGSQLTTTCSQLKLRAADGKMYLSDVANTEQLLRLIQSIPYPKAEPFKLATYLKQENLRDHMTNMELVLNMLAEATTTEISKERKPQSITESTDIARSGGTIAGNTRKKIEAESGKAIISGNQI
jgi:hypothetical protein